LEEGRALAKRQIAALAKVKVRHKGQALTLGTSLGLVQVTAASEEAEALLEAAASACWMAKAAGDNCLHEYEMVASEPIASAQKQEALDWQEWLAQALEGSGLTLYCQRIAPLKQDRSLLPHYAIFPGSSDKDLGLILPADLAPEFVSKAQALDRRTIERVLRWMAIHQAELDNVGAYVIKLSGYALNDQHLMEYIIEQLIDSKVPPSKLCFELQEAAVIAHLADAQRLVRTLREFGCRFSLSGFGKAAASQDYLNRLAIDYLAIDGIFVKEIINNPADHATVKSTHEIARLLGKKTIAYHVETEAVLERLRAIGVDYAQAPHEAPCSMEERV
jgi:EAL domain-containing protein (putative c-di-GMP-specific phosphodiesterase class I)